ncbi:MAG: AAA family ATPase [Bdellovibrionota bacterium]
MGVGNRLSRWVGAILITILFMYPQLGWSTESRTDRENLYHTIWLLNHSSPKTDAAKYEQAKVYLPGFVKYKDFPDVLITLVQIELKKDKKSRSVEKIKLYLETLLEAGDKETVIPKKQSYDVTRFNELKVSLLERINTGNAQDGEFKNKGLEELLDQISHDLRKKNVYQRNFLFTKNDRPITLDAEKLVQASEEFVDDLRAEKEKRENLEKNGVSFDSRKVAFETELLSHVGKDYGEKEIKAGDSSPFELLLAGTKRFITDEVYEDIRTGDYLDITGREKEVKEILLTLSGEKQKNAILTGPAGAGKTTVVEALGQALATGVVEKNKVTEFLKDAIVIETSTGNISRLAKTDKDSGQAFAMEGYLKALDEVQKKLNRRIIVFFDEVHTLSDAHVEAMKPFMDSKRSNLLFIGASTNDEFMGRFKQNKAFIRRFDSIGVEEFSDEKIFEILKEKYLPYISPKRGDFTINDNDLRFAIEQAIFMFPEKGKMAASQQLLDKLPNSLLMENDSQKLHITDDIITDYLHKITKLPVDTRDDFAMEEYRNDLIEKIKEDVKGQDRMIEDVVDTWMEVLRSDTSRGVRVIQLMGRSGVGKTEVVKSMAKHAMGSANHVFTINASEFMEVNEIGMSVIVGAPSSVRGSELSSGGLLDFVDDPARGKYLGIILIDEADKAAQLFYTTLMRLFDEGRLSGRDGGLRFFRRHLIVLTSNAKDKEIFPDDVKHWSKEKIEETLKEFTETRLRELLDQIMPDSVVNRIDRVSLASVITKEIAESIATLIFASIRNQFEEKKKIKLEFDPSVFESYVEAYDPLDRGARFFVRFLKSDLETALTRFLGKFRRDRDERIRFSIQERNSEMKLIVSNDKGEEHVRDFNELRTPSCRSSAAGN